MADVIKRSNNLQLVAAFTDGDDRTISIPNPVSSPGVDQINELSQFIKQHNILLGDKNGADFTRIKTAQIVKGTTRYFDLT